MKKVLRGLAIVVAIAALAVGGLWWYNQKASKTTTATTDTTNLVQTIAVGRGDLTASISPTGEVYTEQSASLSFDVTNLPILELNVAAGQFVKQGDVLARVETDSLQRAVAQAEAGLLDAQESLTEAQTTYTALDEEGVRLAIAQAEVNLKKAKESKEDLLNPDLEASQKKVRDAEYTLQTAQLNLELTKRSTTLGKTVRDLEYTVSWNERNVRDIESGATVVGASETSSDGAALLAQVNAPGGPGGGQQSVEPMTLEEAKTALAEAREALALAKLNASNSLTSAKKRFTQATDALADAQDALAELQAGPNAVELAKADNTIAQAEYKLSKSQDDLATLLAGTDARVVQVAQAKVNAAQVTLAEAQKALESAVMTAPFDGTVIAVSFAAGDEISSNDVILTLANLKALRVRAYVDETKITRVQVGQEAKITFDSFAGKTFKGAVLEVPVEGELSNNVVNYEVPISLEGAESVTLRPGMTANVTIVTASKQNALRLPAYAVSQSTDGYVVTVQDSATGATSSVPVQIGISDGTYVEIVKGLNEGDTIVAQVQEQTQQTGFFGQQQGGGILSGLQRFFR